MMENSRRMGLICICGRRYKGMKIVKVVAAIIKSKNENGRDVMYRC